MDEMRFQELLRKLEKPSGPHGTWESPVFTMEDYESMSPNQLSNVILQMMKFTGPGSYWLRGDLFNLIDCVDRTVSIREDKHLEKFLHMTASLVCLTWVEGKINFDVVLPKRFGRIIRHFERIIGSDPIYSPSMETEPSLQIATFLAYPVLEGVIRRKIPTSISHDGRLLLDKFEVLGRKKPYIKGDRISDICHELQLLEKESNSNSIKVGLAQAQEIKPDLFSDIRKWRNALLHGELTASWHSTTLLLLTYIILLEG